MAFSFVYLLGTKYTLLTQVLIILLMYMCVCVCIYKIQKNTLVLINIGWSYSQWEICNK